MGKENEVFGVYLELLKKYGKQGGYWGLWCKRGKTDLEKEQVALGAMLTQRVSWLNVEKALGNLKSKKALSIKGVYLLGKKDIAQLERLIKPSGFYKQKAKRVFGLCKFIIENYGSLVNFLQQKTATCRQELLALSGIGPETADSILLYAGNKPVFVIDEYTKRLVKEKGLCPVKSYSYLQEFFSNNLPKNVKLYQDFHALIILAGKGLVAEGFDKSG